MEAALATMLSGGIGHGGCARIPVWAVRFREWDASVRNADPNDHEDTPREVVGIGNDYPPAFELARHQHRRSQLLYAAEGVVTVDLSLIHI